MRRRISPQRHLGISCRLSLYPMRSRTPPQWCPNTLRRIAMYPMRRRICPQARGHQAYIGPRVGASHIGKVGQRLGFCVAQRSDMLFSIAKFNTRTKSVAMRNHGA